MRRGGEPAPVGAACSGAAEPVGRSSSQDGGSSRDTRPGVWHGPARPFQVGEVPWPRSPLVNGASGGSRSPLATRPARVNSQAAVRCPSWWHLAEALSASQVASSRQTQSWKEREGGVREHSACFLPFGRQTGCLSRDLGWWEQSQPPGPSLPRETVGPLWWALRSSLLGTPAAWVGRWASGAATPSGVRCRLADNGPFAPCRPSHLPCVGGNGGSVCGCVPQTGGNHIDLCPRDSGVPALTRGHRVTVL